MTGDRAGRGLEGPFATYEELAAVFKEHVAPNKLAFLESAGLPLVLGHREGVYFEDAYTGKQYINCHSNGGVFNLGHANPQVTAAVRGVLGTLDIGNHHFPSGWRARLADRLAATTGDALNRVVFAVGGGEAVDLSIKAARAVTRRQTVVSALGGYHGHTGLAMATGDAKHRDLFGPQPLGYVQVPWDNVAAMDRAVDDGTAAVILESLPATMGMCIPSEGYFAAVRRLCDDRGACLILDEVQTGLGRTGKMWSYEYEGIVPDALVTAKALSGGIYPIAATLLTAALHEPLNQDPFVHISTYGGAEIGCVAGLAVLDIIEQPGFLDRVARLGEVFRDGLAGLPFTLRQRGLFMGLKFEDAGAGYAAMVKLTGEGVLPFPAGNDPSVLQFLPPLIIADDEAADLIGRVRRALG